MIKKSMKLKKKKNDDKLINIKIVINKMKRKYN